MNYDPELAGAILSRTPDVLRASLLGLPTEWLDAPEAPGAWSAREIACHMADLETSAWLPRVRAILEHGTRHPLPGIDRERFRERFSGEPLPVVLDGFAAARRSNLDAIEALDLDDSRRSQTGRHPDLGEVSLAQLLSTWVVHDLTHLAQIDRALAAQYRDAVGPWREYLSVLRANPPANPEAWR